MVCVMLSGCELDRPNFQMNSNSRNPFFGIDVLPRRRTTSIVSPQAGEQVASVESSSRGINPVDETPSLSRFWKRNVKETESTQRTVVLPLTETNPDHPIDRGPVELLP